MKLKIFFISIISLIIANSKDCKSELYSLEIGKIKSESFEGDKFYKVPVTLVNNTSEALYYYTMTCSWQEFYFTSNPIFKIKERVCEYNAAEIIKLPPKSKSTQILEIEKHITDNKKVKFKIGLFLLKSNGFNQEYLSGQIFPELVENAENRKKFMIWSKKIEL